MFGLIAAVFVLESKQKRFLSSPAEQQIVSVPVVIPQQCCVCFNLCSWTTWTPNWRTCSTCAASLRPSWRTERRPRSFMTSLRKREGWRPSRMSWGGRVRSHARDTFRCVKLVWNIHETLQFVRESSFTDQDSAAKWLNVQTAFLMLIHRSTLFSFATGRAALYLFLQIADKWC